MYAYFVFLCRTVGHRLVIESSVRLTKLSVIGWLNLLVHIKSYMQIFLVNKNKFSF